MPVELGKVVSRLIEVGAAPVLSVLIVVMTGLMPSLKRSEAVEPVFCPRPSSVAAMRAIVTKPSE